MIDGAAVRAAIRHYEERVAAQASMRAVWQLLADLWRPGGENYTRRSTASGQDERRGRVFNSTHIHAAAQFTSAMEDLILPKRRPWFYLTIGEDPSKVGSGAQKWLEETRQATMRAIYALHSGFDGMLDGLLSSVTELGVGVGLINEVDGRPMFQHVPSAEVVWDRDPNGRVDLVMRRCHRSLRFLAGRAERAIQPWSLHPSISDRIRQAKETGNGWGDTVDVLYVVRPREGAVRPPPGEKGFVSRLPFEELIIDVANAHLMHEGGYYEMPYIVAVWCEPQPDNVWSPARSALPDTLALQRMTEDMLHGWRGVSRPPYFAPNDFLSSLGGLRLGPNAVNYYDPSALPPNRAPVDVLQLDVRIAELYQGILEWENKVRKHFLNDLFLLGVGGERSMTATEVLRRNNDLLRAAGSMFGKLEAQLNHVIVTRVLAILRRASEAAGWDAERGSPLSMPPGELDPAEPIRIVIENDMARARRMVGVTQVGAGLEVILPLLNIRPAAAEALKTEDLLRAVVDSQMGPGYTRSEEETKARQEAQAQAQLAQAAAEVAPKLAQAAETVAGLPVTPSNPVTQLPLRAR